MEIYGRRPGLFADGGGRRHDLFPERGWEAIRHPGLGRERRIVGPVAKIWGRNAQYCASRSLAAAVEALQNLGALMGISVMAAQRAYRAGVVEIVVRSFGVDVGKALGQKSILQISVGVIPGH